MLRWNVVDVLIVVGILCLVLHCMLADFVIFTPNDLYPLFRSGTFLLLFLYINRCISLGRHHWGITFLFLIHPSSKVQVLNLRQHEARKVVGIVAVACADLGIKPIAAADDTKDANIGWQNGIESTTEHFIVLITIDVHFAGEHILQGVYPLISTSGPVEGNLFKVTKVVIRNATKLMQCLFDLLLDRAHIRVLL